MPTIQRTVELTVTDCPKCFISFAVPAELLAQRAENGGDWYCPLGHSVRYVTSNVDRLKGELAKAAQKLEQAETRARDAAQDARDELARRLATERRLTAAKGVTTRLKKRVANGVCPCCNRTFANLGRHMAGQHPDWKDGEESSDGP